MTTRASGRQDNFPLVCLFIQDNNPRAEGPHGRRLQVRGQGRAPRLGRQGPQPGMTMTCNFMSWQHDNIT